MPKAADGQYEMVLENRHVMTLFFVVIVLCGVFFGLGYIVGKNTVATGATAAQQQDATAAKEEGKKNPLASAGKKADTAASDLTFQKTLEDKGAAPGLEAAQPANRTASGTSAPAAPPAETKPAAPPVAAQQPAAAAIIQVGALKNRTDADSMASTLKDRGFAPVIEQQPDGLFHVFIPVSSAGDADAMKARVEKAGFKAFIKKR